MKVGHLIVQNSAIILIRKAEIILVNFLTDSYQRLDFAALAPLPLLIRRERRRGPGARRRHRQEREGLRYVIYNLSNLTTMAN